MNPSVRPTDCEKLLDTYGTMLFRLCLMTLGNVPDAEDAVSETLLRYLQKAPHFESEDHEKAWLLRVATNYCRDHFRKHRKNPPIPWDEVTVSVSDGEDLGVLEAFMTLPEPFRKVMALHYVAGYHTEEIAKIIGKSPSAVKMRLQKGRKLLREAYERREYRG